MIGKHKKQKEPISEHCAQCKKCLYNSYKLSWCTIWHFPISPLRKACIFFMSKNTNKNTTFTLCKLCIHNIDGFCTFWHHKMPPLTSCKHFNGL